MLMCTDVPFKRERGDVPFKSSVLVYRTHATLNSRCYSSRASRRTRKNMFLLFKGPPPPLHVPLPTESGYFGLFFSYKILIRNSSYRYLLDNICELNKDSNSGCCSISYLVKAVSIQTTNQKTPDPTRPDQTLLHFVQIVSTSDCYVSLYPPVHSESNQHNKNVDADLLRFRRLNGDADV